MHLFSSLYIYSIFLFLFLLYVHTLFLFLLYVHTLLLFTDDCYLLGCLQNLELRTAVIQLVKRKDILGEITRFMLRDFTNVLPCYERNCLLKIANQIQFSLYSTKIMPNVFQMRAFPRYLQDIYNEIDGNNQYVLANPFRLPKAYFTLERIIGSTGIGSILQRIKYYCN